jgi:hypothetical protein
MAKSLIGFLACEARWLLWQENARPKTFGVLSHLAEKHAKALRKILTEDRKLEELTADVEG